MSVEDMNTVLMDSIQNVLIFKIFGQEWMKREGERNTELNTSWTLRGICEPRINSFN